MPVNSARSLNGIPLRTLKATLLRGESEVQKLNSDAGDVIDTARKGAHLEVKQMADALGCSESYVHRGLKSQDGLSFHKLWDLSDDFWAELLAAIARKRNIAHVRTLIEIPDRRHA